jgi:hypothetical protein
MNWARDLERAIDIRDEINDPTRVTICHAVSAFNVVSVKSPEASAELFVEKAARSAVKVPGGTGVQLRRRYRREIKERRAA